MPGMHIRYNDLAKQYEYSYTGTDLGPWYVLQLVNNITSGGGGSVAFTNKFEQSFTERQNIIPTTAAGLNYNEAPLEIQQVSNPRISFHWPGVVASQIGMDSAGIVRTFNNPGTGYETFAAARIYSSEYMFPAAVTNPGAIQSSWYLGAHSSFGLYTNTGLYVAGGIWPGNGGIHFPAAQIQHAGVNSLDDYEVGTWTPQFLGWSGHVFSVQVGVYVKIGRFVAFSGRTCLTVRGAANEQLGLYISLPFYQTGGPAGQAFTGATITRWSGFTATSMLAPIWPGVYYMSPQFTRGETTDSIGIIGGYCYDYFDICFEGTMQVA